MDIDSYDHGVPSWVDLQSSNPAAARQFYGGLFGWDVEEGPPEAGGYALAMLRGRAVAGIGPMMAPAPISFWSTYVNVDDADAIAAVVPGAGGQVYMPPMDVMDVGRMAVFADPAGAAFGVWQPGAHKGAGIVNEPNTLCWNELVTTDVEGCKAFYATVFGWGAATHGEGPSAYTEWQLGGRSIGGMMARPPQMPAEAPNYWGVYFAVEDCDAAVAKATGLGGSVALPPMDIEPGRFSLLADPTGAMFSVITMRSAT